MLPGWSVFDRADARRAGRALLRRGRVRIKPAHLLGGVGQHVVADAGALDAAIASIDAGELHEHGAVIEQNVELARTLSVGAVSAAGLQIAYHGTTRDHRGREVYGGSDLEVVRGTLAGLLRHPLAGPVRQAMAARATRSNRARRRRKARSAASHARCATSSNAVASSIAIRTRC